jgi:hypothetical protein
MPPTASLPSQQRPFIGKRSPWARARAGTLALIIALVTAACGDDGPTGPSDDFDIVGQWSWRVTNAQADNASCSVTGVTITFQRNDGTLTGHRVATGGGNVTCTVNGSDTTSNYTTNDDLDNLSLNGTDIAFSFATTGGTWEMSGAIENDDTMGGTATIRLATTTGALALTGPWTATRN